MLNNDQSPRPCECNCSRRVLEDGYDVWGEFVDIKLIKTVKVISEL